MMATLVDVEFYQHAGSRAGHQIKQQNDVSWNDIREAMQNVGIRFYD
jgi:hypothetical protein